MRLFIMAELTKEKISIVSDRDLIIGSIVSGRLVGMRRSDAVRIRWPVSPRVPCGPPPGPPRGPRWQVGAPLRPHLSRGTRAPGFRGGAPHRVGWTPRDLCQGSALLTHLTHLTHTHTPRRVPSSCSSSSSSSSFSSSSSWGAEETPPVRPTRAWD